MSRGLHHSTERSCAPARAHLCVKRASSSLLLGAREPILYMRGSLTGASLLLLSSAPLACASWGPNDFFAGTGYSKVPSGSPGDADCPCINPFDAAFGVTNLGTPSAGTPDVPTTYDPGSGGTADCAWLRAPAYGQMCYPSSYGSEGCKAYDMTISPECSGIPGYPEKCADRTFKANPNNPDCNSCASTWCFVDPRNCYKPNSPSSYFPEATYGRGGPRLSYSYETCGNVDTWEYKEKRLQELKALEPIRLSWPDVGGAGYTITRDTTGGDGYGGTGHDGAITQFVVDALRQYNISYVAQRERSASSIAYGKAEEVGSSYTSCVHEVALNRTDLCIGEFWQTDERLQLAAFTRAMYSDTFHVIAWRTADDTSPFFWIAKTFSVALGPFDGQLWMLLILTYAVAGISMWIIEGAKNREDFPVANGKADSVWEGVFRSLQSFLGGEDHRFSPRTRLGKVIVSVLSFSSLVMISLYTAKMTTLQIYLAQTDKTAAGELVRVINSGGKVCGYAVQKNELIARIDDLPGLDTDKKSATNEYYVTVSEAQPLLWSLDATPPKCHVGIVFSDAWDLLRTGWYSPKGPGWDASQTESNGSITGYPGVVERWNSWPGGSDEHVCGTKILLRDSSFTFSMDNAMPVRKEAQPAITWLMTERIKRIPFNKIRREAQEKFVFSQKPLMCNLNGNLNSLDATQNRITIRNGGGITVISLCVILALLIFFVFRDRYERQQRLHEMEQAIAANSPSPLAIDLLMQPPSLGNRLTRKNKRNGNSNNDPVRDRSSTAYRDDDLKCVEQMISARQLTTERCHDKFNSTAKEPLDSLCVSDVPMLLRLIRRSAKLGAAEVLATTGLVSELSSEFKDDLQHGKEWPEEMLLSAWPEDKAEQVKRFGWKHGKSFNNIAQLAKRRSQTHTKVQSA